MLSKNKRFRESHSGNTPKSAAMADSSERKRSLKLSLFVGLAESFASEPTTARSPRCFDDGAVGLGIVAAMSKAVGDARAPATALSRTAPIPIVLGRPPGSAKQREPAARDEEDEELSESYTCVISHVRGNPVTKRVYFGDGFRGVDGNYRRSSEVFFGSPLPPPPPPAMEFLSRCFLCHKELHGLDVFMYRGEKAFCSVECRCQQILRDEHREKCGSEESPCSTPLLFAPGVVAA